MARSRTAIRSFSGVASSIARSAASRSGATWRGWDPTSRAMPLRVLRTTSLSVGGGSPLALWAWEIETRRRRRVAMAASAWAQADR